MSWLGFIAIVISALAWPLVVLVLGLVFRSEIKGLLKRPLDRLEIGPFKANWLRVLAEVESNVDVRGAGKGAGPQGPGDATFAAQTDLRQLARTDPSSAVFAAHDLIYQRLQGITGQDFGSPPLPATVAALARDARARGLISDEMLRALEGITVLRNLAAHGGAGEVTPERALEYITQVEALLYVLAQTQPVPRK